jgi:hypothetical protein
MTLDIWWHAIETGTSFTLSQEHKYRARDLVTGNIDGSGNGQNSHRFGSYSFVVICSGMTCRDCWLGLKNFSWVPWGWIPWLPCSFFHDMVRKQRNYSWTMFWITPSWTLRSLSHENTVSADDWLFQSRLCRRKENLPDRIFDLQKELRKRPSISAASRTCFAWTNRISKRMDGFPEQLILLER